MRAMVYSIDLASLADLLEMEEHQYKAQLAAMQPTVEDRRQELERRAFSYASTDLCLLCLIFIAVSNKSERQSDVHLSRSSCVGNGGMCFSTWLFSIIYSMVVHASDNHAEVNAMICVASSVSYLLRMWCRDAKSNCRPRMSFSAADRRVCVLAYAMSILTSITEEQLFNQQWEADIQRKMERERREEERAKLMAKETLLTLDEQVCITL